MSHAESIPLRSAWTHVDPKEPAPGRGLRHLVTSLEPDEEDKATLWVTTWSEPLPEGGEIAGFSWHGPAADFLKQFRRCTPTKK